MTEKSDITKYFTDASFSWNGYNYQGKVGLFIALKKIGELLESNKELDDYCLELEWLEDFSIKKGSKYITIHQVKTYNSSNISKYKDAIWTLFAKILVFHDLDKAVLHSTKAFNMPEDFFENYCISKPSKSAKNPRIKSPYESCKEVIESGQKDSILKKFEIYNYGNKEEKVYCCSFDEIEVKIKSLLEILSEGYASKERVDRAYHCLLGLIDTNIKERHKNIQEKNEEDKVNIKFSDMKAIIDRNHDMPSKEYTLYYMRNKFQHIAAIYTDNILMKEYELGMISHQTIDIFQQSLAQIYDLNEKDFYEFCLKIVPDNEVIGDSVDCELALLSDCLSRQNLENCYFEILKQIQQVIENKKWVFNKRMPDMKNITYLPSTIIDDDSFVKKELLIKRIHNNDNLDLLREVDKIITKSITVPSIDENKIYENIPEPDDSSNKIENDKYHDRITVMKKVGLIKLEDAKERLK